MYRTILGVIIIEWRLKYKVLFLVLLLSKNDETVSRYSWCYYYRMATEIQGAILGVITIEKRRDYITLSLMFLLLNGD